MKAAAASLLLSALALASASSAALDTAFAVDTLDLGATEPTSNAVALHPSAVDKLAVLAAAFKNADVPISPAALGDLIGQLISAEIAAVEDMSLTAAAVANDEAVEDNEATFDDFLDDLVSGSEPRKDGRRPPPPPEHGRFPHPPPGPPPGPPPPRDAPHHHLPPPPPPPPPPSRGKWRGPPPPPYEHPHDHDHGHDHDHEHEHGRAPPPPGPPPHGPPRPPGSPPPPPFGMRPVRRPRPGHDDDERPPPRWFTDEREREHEHGDDWAPRTGHAQGQHHHHRHHHHHHHQHRHRHRAPSALSRLAHSARSLARTLGASPALLGAWAALRLGLTAWACVVLVKAVRARRAGRVRLEGEEEEGREEEGREKV
ncbi:hypothetical protein JCM9279_002697 [Rhodotorula babjevae]